MPKRRPTPSRKHAITGPFSPRGNDVTIPVNNEYEMLVRESHQPTSSNEPRSKGEKMNLKRSLKSSSSKNCSQPNKRNAESV